MKKDVASIYPTVIYQDGDTHEVSAIIILANFTPYSFEQINVSKYDMASITEDYVDSGYVNSHFEKLLPDQYIIIDKLSSFDLEYICDYAILLTQKVNDQVIELKFKLQKYGRFEGKDEEYYFKEINTKGNIIKTEVRLI